MYHGIHVLTIFWIHNLTIFLRDAVRVSTEYRGRLATWEWIQIWLIRVFSGFEKTDNLVLSEDAKCDSCSLW